MSDDTSRAPAPTKKRVRRDIYKAPKAYAPPYLTQSEAARLLRLVQAQPQKHWDTTRRKLEEALAKARSSDAETEKVMAQRRERAKEDSPP